MDKVENIEFKLYQIIHGQYYINIDGINYKSVPNTPQDHYEANLLAIKETDNIKYENVMSWEAAKFVSNNLGIWTHENESSLKMLEKSLEDLKYNLFLENYSPTKVKQYRKRIKQIKTGINKSYENKYHLYTHTKEHHIDEVKKNYLAAVSIRDGNGNKVTNYETYHLCQSNFIKKIRSDIDKYYVSIDEIRCIARNEPWRSMWTSSKSDVFGIAAIHWTFPQRMIVSFSRMYDSVYESTECPDDEVIADDDMLDGWFIKQKRDRDKKKKEKATDEKFGGRLKNNNGSQELFVMSRNKEEAGEIYNMNDAESQAAIQMRSKKIKDKGEVKHQDLPDVRMDLRMQATNEMRDNMRNR